MTNSQRFDKWFADYTGVPKQEQQRRLAKVIQLDYFREMRELIGKHLTSITIITPNEQEN